jgi:hypothetical protein
LRDAHGGIGDAAGLDHAIESLMGNEFNLLLWKHHERSSQRDLRAKMLDLWRAS